MRGTKLQAEGRVTSLVRILLDGAATWDVREFVAQEERNPESPWFLQEGEQPRSYAGIMKCLRTAKQVVAAEGNDDREQLLRQHIAKRNTVYAKAMESGDLRAALACLDSQAKLLGLFPKEKTPNDKGQLPSLAVLVQAVINSEKQTVETKAALVVKGSDDEERSPSGITETHFGDQALPRELGLLREHVLQDPGIE
ncbi:MAG: hypothetical protein K2X38_00230 [Gemmataceae bacterium]|nr:hypothetical protein [Gemmataceae bacterium]